MPPNHGSHRCGSPFERRGPNRDGPPQDFKDGVRSLARVRHKRASRPGLPWRRIRSLSDGIAGPELYPSSCGEQGRPLSPHPRLCPRCKHRLDYRDLELRTLASGTAFETRPSRAPGSTTQAISSPLCRPSIAATSRGTVVRSDFVPSNASCSLDLNSDIVASLGRSSSTSISILGSNLGQMLNKGRVFVPSIAPRR